MLSPFLSPYHPIDPLHSHYYPVFIPVFTYMIIKFIRPIDIELFPNYHPNDYHHDIPIIWLFYAIINAQVDG